jgi:hypothetical protein
LAQFKDGDTRPINGVMYVRQNGQWLPQQQGVKNPFADPRLPYQVQQEQGQAAASQFAPRKEQVGIQKTESEIVNDRERVRLDRQQFEADLAKQGLMLDARGNVVPRPGGSVLPPKPDAKQQVEDTRQISDLKTVANQLNRVQELYNSDFRGAGIGSVGEYLRTGRNQRFDSQTAALATMMKPLIRGPGEGTWTDADQKRLDRLVPNSWAHDADNEERISTAMRFIEERVAKHGGSSHRERVGGPQTDEDFRAGIEQKLKAGEDPSSVIKWLIDSGRPPDKDTIAAIIANAGNPNPEVRPPARSSFEVSPLGQGLSGANEGLASVLGAPADLSAAVINSATGGLNTLAGTNIPRIDRPFLGSKQITDGLTAFGSITPPANHPFARRVGESIGASAIPMGRAGYGAQLLMGAGGGLGAATAQQAFPGNTIAEIGGELLGGGATAGGLTRALKRNSQRQIEAAVPTVPQLKQQAGDLYRAAESRGVVAGPSQTTRLNDDFRQTLMDEGRLSPTGRITEAYPKAKEAAQLVGDYAGQPMSPTQMQSVRKVISDGLSSAEPAERRLSGMLTETFDNFANPLAPELREARDVSSRYLTAQQLQQARELAGAQASQFTGSGFENALRTQYRGLDRGAIKGSKHFSNDVGDAIEKVSRGTPMSNALRGLGRLAPTGPVSSMGSIVPAMGIGAATDPLTGGMFGAALAGAGMAGRAGATKMGIRAADQAELVARNGGKLPPPTVSPEWDDLMRRIAAIQAIKYLPEQ